MDKNISTLLREIKDASNWSEPRIAAEIGTSQPTVNRILNGQDECKGSTLRSITALHRKVCGKGAATLRATTAAPASAHGGRQPPTTNNILDTVPEHAAVVATPGENA